MTPEEKAWLVKTLSDPTLRTILERLAPHSEKLVGVLRLAQALDRARAQLEAEDAPYPAIRSRLLMMEKATTHGGPQAG